jgi:miniconductance mechanosensitive channel
LTQRIKEFLVHSGTAEAIAAYLAKAIVAVAVIAGCVLAYFVAKKLLLALIGAAVRKSKGKWDDKLYSHGVFDRLILLIPAIILYFCAPVFGVGTAFVRGAAVCIIVLAALLAFGRLLDSVDDIYRGYEMSKLRPIKGYLQVLKIGAYVIAIVLGVSALLDKSPAWILGGIGAATAVLLLIFQNTLLGFVASIQLTENDMLRIGDMIEMPGHSANGLVVDISLHTVKVQNWDNSITTIPTYTLVSESFCNWRGMFEKGARRIKRAINIDMRSVRFLDSELKRELEKMPYLKEYMDGCADGGAENILQPTNLGAFRAYITGLLRNSPDIRGDMTQVVRQLEPTEHGIPVEIYAFAATTQWSRYEEIQFGIFEHILAIMPRFGLRVFQNISGSDLAVADDKL